MAKFAANTEVSAEKSRAEIESILRRYGASGFSYGWDEDINPPVAVLAFRVKTLRVQFMLKMPAFRDLKLTPVRGTVRSPQQQREAWEQATRQRWRALTLVVKAKLEAVEAKISTFEQEFMAHIVLPNGQTVGDYVIPQIAAAYENNQMPKLLPGIGQTGVNQ